MTALESLKAEIADLKASFLAFVGKAPKAPRAEGETDPDKEKENAEGEGDGAADPEKDKETPEGEGPVPEKDKETPEGEEDTDKETPDAEDDEEKEKAAEALTKLVKLEASINAKVTAIKAELEKSFDARVAKAAAAQVLKASGKPLAKAADQPAEGTPSVDAVTGIDRMKAAMVKRRAK